MIFLELDIFFTKLIIILQDVILHIHSSHLQNFFEPHIPDHDHDTRNNPSSEYSIPPGSVSLNNIETDSLKYKCAQDWNEMLKTLSRANDRTHRFIDISIASLKYISKAHFIGAY